jgi:transglutaminase-like putative cysteine protease
MPRILLSLSIVLVLLSPTLFAQSSRSFTFHYGFAVKNVPVGQKVRVWFPAAHSDDFQDIKVMSAKGDLPLKRTREPRFGNEIYYAESSNAKPRDLHFSVDYQVVRREHLTLGVSRPHLQNPTLSKKEYQRDLAPDRLVPITGIPAELAMKVTGGRTFARDKARAIYDYVFENMRYDKTGTGWGQGDVLYACDAKKGNCTDFHSLFIAMTRSQGIPSRFEIGFPLPTDRHSSDIAGYHCWAEFFDPQIGWIPVDISEAWKHPMKKDYFFGAHDTERIQFTIGRDLRLSPPQAGEPLNYFVYPYVEVGNNPYPNVSNEFSFADAPGAQAPALTP